VAGAPPIGEDRRVARVIAALTVAAALAAVGFELADPVAARAATAPLVLAGLLTPAAVGLFVALRRPGNRVAWILQLGPLSVATVLAVDGASVDGKPVSGP
jgi:peptidoglycan/LPS O-acetylase OafA/YrhL